MAQVILTGVGAALGGPIGGALGGLVGGLVDRAAINALSPPRQIGPRIPGVRVQTTGEGQPMVSAWGRARVAGQVIWAARFKERRIEGTAGGGKGGPRTVEYRYSLSFAVALCEGPIDGIGRVWADGKPLDVSALAMRVYLGGEDQAPDALIEAIEGEAPAYRGTAYVVFEDLALEPFGNRLPQLSFEIFRNPGGDLERLLTGVCMIPGAGEFVYATEPVLKRDGLIATQAENVNNTRGGPDFLLALDQLEAQLPNVSQVTLVVAWFGTDLRCGLCEIRPGVEVAAKDTTPISWSVNGLERADARLISQQDGGPAYGGTPADATVIAAIQELKSRGYSVGLYPFVLMDVPPGNELPDPYGAAEQAPYPWRGRITCHPAAGQPESADQTPDAADQVEAFFDGEWGFRRMVLHCADLAAQAGGVDAFLIGSELRGLTWVRSGPSSYPAVALLKALAADCRAVLGPETAISYAADWSEYFGHQPPDGSGDAHFHLDPLWADDAIDFVGLDWYAPMADWRDGTAHLDAQAGWRNTRQVNYLRANLAGGEGFDWYYFSPEDRTAQVRTPITDGAYDEPWIYRYKDLISWWSNAHHDRPGGMRAGTSTDWVPQSKPLRFIEFGCPAVDKGANSPNLFIDPKSSESFLPPFSNGRRDDLMQRRALEAVLKHFGEAEANPTSAVYDGPMLEAMAAWCWDARPYPDFPARDDVWKDAPNWTLGHWLNGRVGSGTLADLVRALGMRAALELDVEDLEGEVTGYVVERPMRLADAIAPLASAYGFDGAERELPTFLMRERQVAATLGAGDLAFDGERPEATQGRVLEPSPQTLRVRFIDEQADYQTGAVAVRRDPMEGAQGADTDLPIVMGAGEAEVSARRMLRAAGGARDELVLGLSAETALALETGDVVRVEGRHGDWRVTRLDRDARPTAVLALAEPGELAPVTAGGWTPPPPIPPHAPPVLHLMDLPPLPGFEDDARPLVAVAAEPWRAMEVHAGPSTEALTVRAQVPQPATVGVTRTDLPAGPLHRFSPGAALEVELAAGRLESRPLEAVLAGANALAVRGEGGAWEVLQFLSAEQVAPRRWQLTGLLRGQLGSEPAMAALTEAGAPVVVLAGDLARGAVALDERGLPLVWRAAPAGGPPGGPGSTETGFTWRATALRPWSPAHLRMAEDGGDLAIRWMRRARVGGDSWDIEPPLSEAFERYRVEVLDGGDIVRTAEVGEAAFTYTAAMQATDFPGGTPSPLSVRVAQASATVGWGAAAERAL